MRHHPTVLLAAATAAGTLTALAPTGHDVRAAIDECMTAAETFPDAPDVWSAIGAHPDLSTFADTVETAGATDLFTGDGPVTVLAPTNAAFDAIPPNVFEAILADADVLTTVIEYHVIPGIAATADDLAATGSAVSATGDDLAFEPDGYDVIVEDQALACGHGSFANGTIIVLDNVLVPPSDTEATGGSSVPSSSPAAFSGEEADIATAFETAVDSSLTYDDQAPFIDDAESIRATIENYPTAAEAVLGITATVTSVHIDGDTAAITYTLAFNGVEAPYGELDGTMALVDGQWVVPLDEYCAFQAQAFNACPS